MNWHKRLDLWRHMVKNFFACLDVIKRHEVNNDVIYTSS